MDRFNRVIWPGAVVAALLTFPVLVLPARAVAPIGACCLPDLNCQEVIELDCMAQGGQFIDGSCASIQCQAGVEVPVLSILGLVGAAGALGGIGAYRLFRKRR